MKKTILSLFASLLVVASFAQSETHVNGYFRSNGTYVEAHYRTTPNYTISDNWSTVGNQNPHTGEWGTKCPTHEYNSSFTPAYTPAPTYTTTIYDNTPAPTTNYRNTNYNNGYFRK